MNKRVFIVRKGAEVSLWRENRRAQQIKTEGYLRAVTEEMPQRFYINQNKGILM